jgi:tryptophan synthase alpha chain
MNRIDNLFMSKGGNILSVYFTAGYPEIDSTVKLIKELADQGVDMIEIGMPFSDPVADGPVIQDACQVALGNGMSVKTLLRQLEGIRKSVDIPLLLMGYLNPVMRYGMENFCEKARETGIDGLILPDLPMEEYNIRYRKIFERYELYPVFLITPQTPEERIRLIDHTGKGFIYMVSVSSTTGRQQTFGQEQMHYFKRIKNMDLKLPRLVGFGVWNNDTYTVACRYASGAIIGSAFIKEINHPADFIRRIRTGRSG